MGENLEIRCEHFLVRKIDIEGDISLDDLGPKFVLYPKYSCAECEKSFVDKNNSYFKIEDGLYERI